MCYKPLDGAEGTSDICAQIQVSVHNLHPEHDCPVDWESQ